MSQQIRPTGDYATTLDDRQWEVVGPVTAERLALRRPGDSRVEHELPLHAPCCQHAPTLMVADPVPTLPSVSAARSDTV